MDARLLGLAGMLVLLTLSPGPDMALVARHAASGGRRAAVRASVGVCSGLVVHGALAAAGLAVLLRAPALLAVVAGAGGCYLVWLGVKAWREEPTPEAVAGARPFREGFVSNVLNPKVALFYLGVVAAFGFAAWWQPLLVTLVHGLFSVAFYSLAGVVFARAAPRAGWLRRAAAVALVGTGAWALASAARALA